MRKLHTVSCFGLLCFLFIFTGGLSGQVPVIMAFSPVSAPVGSSITINGTGFDPVTTNNTVFFGAVQAAVTTSSTTIITCIVPTGANYQPITVSVNGLTGYSRLSFTTTFSGIGILNQNTFSSYQDYPGISNTFGTHACDLDLDGKPELLFTNLGGQVSVLRNSSVSGTVLFAAPQNFLAGAGANSIATGDFDGDGKPDIAVSNSGANNFSFLKNTSTPGSISFATKIDYPAGANPGDIVVRDIDSDGKPDIIITNRIINMLAIFRNNSSGGIVSFEPRVEYSTAAGPRSLAATDLDNDGKTDIVVSSLNVNSVSCFRNLSTPGIILFDTRADFVIQGVGYGCAVGDIDRDGLPDLAATAGNGISLLRNTSSGGSISFAPKIDLSAQLPESIIMCDLTGEGNGDIIVTNSQSGAPASIQIFKNNSTPGSFVFEPRVVYGMGGSAIRIVSCDWDGDGITDLAATKSNQVTVLKNKINEPYITSFSPSFGSGGTLVTIGGTNFTGASVVTIGNQPAASFTVISPTQIDATIGIPAAGNIIVTTATGTDSITSFTLPPPIITGFSPQSDTVGAIVTIIGDHFGANPSDNMVYVGAAKATILSASVNTITVRVPVGTTHEPISVITRSLTAYSNKPFNTIFPGNGLISTSSFSPKIDFPTGSTPQNVSVADLDGDGRQDIAVSNFNSNSVSIYRNLSVPGLIAMAPRIDIVLPGNAGFVKLGDLNGDGKPDMVTGADQSILSIFRNTSSPGSISFAPRNDNGGFGFPRHIAIDDYNKDGRPDIAVANAVGGNIAFMKNFSYLPDHIYLLGQPSVGNLGYPQDISTADLNNDGKQDIISTEDGASFPATIRNYTEAGAWSFTFTVNTLALGSLSPHGNTLSDLDNDNLPDVVFANSSFVRLVRNTSIPSTISYAAPTNWPSAVIVRGVASNDLNGDGKLDIIVGGGYVASSLYVYKNISSTGNLALSPKFDLQVGNAPADIITADIDADGKPDIISLNGGAATISILRNKYNEPYRQDLCPPTGNTTLTSNLSGSNYQWQVDAGTGYANISDNSNYAGTNSGTLQLTSIPSAWTGYLYRCVVDGSNSEPFLLKFVNTWTGAVNSNWENPANWSCGTIPDENTDVIITIGTVVVNANTTIRTLTMFPGVNFSVASGVTLTILF